MFKIASFAHMTLTNYIADLLYRYDCVIVPNFGGFVTNKISAQVDTENNTFYPPKKQLTFNVYLQHNDGLLANHIASVEKISFEEATNKIALEVNKWKEQLKNSTITLGKIGSLELSQDNKLLFEPNITSNFLKESFGLSETEANEIKRYQQKVVALPETKEAQDTSKVIPIAKRTAVAAVAITMLYAGWNGIQHSKRQETLANQQKSLEEKIQSATFVIDKPLPTINLKVNRENRGNIHIIAGAFQLVDNANNKVEELQKLGYDAYILGKNSWGLIQVALESYQTKEEARRELINIKETVSEDAWLLEK